MRTLVQLKPRTCLRPTRISGRELLLRDMTSRLSSLDVARRRLVRMNESFVGVLCVVLGDGM